MSTNDITGDKLISKPATESYRDNYDRIFKRDGARPAETEGRIVCKSCRQRKPRGAFPTDGLRIGVFCTNCAKGMLNDK